jgi:probable HAF family extracellular repeat protein
MRRTGSFLAAAMIGVGLGLGTGATGTALATAPYTLADLGGSGGAESAVTALNAYGDAGGYSQIDGGAFHAFVISGGERRDLGTLGGADSYVYALNNTGQAAGWSQTMAGDRHAFLWQNGALTELNPSGAASSLATGINDRGEVVGAAQSADGPTHAILWRPGQPALDLGTGEGVSSFATGINNVGQVVGYGMLASGARFAFLWEQEQSDARGRMRNLGALGGTSARANGINDLGQVVGQAQTADGDFHAFLYDGAGMLDLNPPGSQHSTALALNNLSQVTGLASPAASAGPAIARAPIGEHPVVWDGRLLKLGKPVSAVLTLPPAEAFFAPDLPHAGGEHALPINDAGELGGEGDQDRAVLAQPLPWAPVPEAAAKTFRDPIEAVRQEISSARKIALNQPGCAADLLAALSTTLDAAKARLMPRPGESEVKEARTADSLLYSSLQLLSHLQAQDPTMSCVPPGQMDGWETRLFDLRLSLQAQYRQ